MRERSEAVVSAASTIRVNRSGGNADAILSGSSPENESEVLPRPGSFWICFRIKASVSPRDSSADELDQAEERDRRFGSDLDLLAQVFRLASIQQQEHAVCLERLGRDLHTDRVARHDIQVPARMSVGAALRCDDHDLATEVAIDQRSDMNVRRLATHTFDQAVRGHRTASDRTQVQDVAPRATGGQIGLEVLADPVASCPATAGFNPDQRPCR